MGMVEPMFKTNQGECEGNQARCSFTDCPKFGTLGKVWRDGKRRVRGCGDPSARGARNRLKGDSKARRARKGLRIAGANTRHEELWGGVVRTESKAGAAAGANKVWTAYRNARAQSDAAHPVGNTQPFIALFCPDGTRHVIYSIRDDDLEAVVFALAEAWGFGGDV